MARRVRVAGGTRFIGRHLVEFLLDAGHEVTLFNRGQTNPDLFPEAERIRGDRTDPPAALLGITPEIGTAAWDGLGRVPAVSRTGRNFSTRRAEAGLGFPATPFAQTIAATLQGATI
jgi:uncharacterized protein YbjT (DUF2867 family)